MRIDADLTHASRETLLMVTPEQQATISELQATIDALRRRIGDPERRVLPGGGRPLGMPGSKSTPSRRQPDEPDERKPRKRRERGFARRRMEPTGREVHALESCPECGTGLTGGWVQRTGEVIDVPPAPVEVTEHVLVARMCPDMRKTPGRGVNLMSRSRLWTAHRLKISAGAIVEATHRVAQPARPAVADTPERIRGSPVVHADETGRREGGVNGYAWTFSAPGERYFLRRGRGKAVVDEAPGESFGGVLLVYLRQGDS